MNMAVMEQHFALISQKTEYGRHAVIIIDDAAWHQTYLADKFTNLTIIKLPPYSSELNPIEQVWSWLRQHHLANRCFQGYVIFSTLAQMHGAHLYPNHFKMQDSVGISNALGKALIEEHGYSLFKINNAA